jgi:multidrug efflux pump subunit AcrA (membrane-fusion protein)
MRAAHWSIAWHRSSGRRWLALALALVASVPASGCGSDPAINFGSDSGAPSVRLIQPPIRTIVRVVGQPSFIESYERTSIYPKVTAYIEKWIVDIGDKVKKGEVLATLFVPELVESLRTKIADVALDKERIVLARKMVDVAEADVRAARARVEEARSELDKFQDEVDRWETEVKRLKSEVERGVVDPSILLESTNQFKSSAAARDAAQAVITTAQSELLAKQAADAKARVGVAVAQAALAVAESEQRRLQAWVDYLTLTAPFDGVVVVRNANTFDFVLPAAGDPTARQTAPDESPGRAAPIYVVDRTDVVRVFVDIPEQDANFVQPGTKATVLARAFRDDAIPASVTRTAWALNVKSYTLRAEIDLPNTDRGLLPGMYAYVKVMIEHPGVRALPVDALVYSGDKTFCWLHQNGHSVRAEIQTGVSDGEWVEVTNLQLPAASKGAGHWTPIDGSEEVILGDLSMLADGGPVKVASPTVQVKVAGAPRADPQRVAGGGPLPTGGK